MDLLLLTAAVIVCILVFSVLWAVVALLLPAFKGQKMSEVAQSTKLNVTVQAFAYLVILAVMRRVVRLHGTGLLQGIKWNWPGQNAILYPALGVGLAVGIQALTSLLQRFIPSNLPIEKMFRTPGDAWFLVAFGITLAPVLEEFYFRGFLYPTLARRIGVGFAATFTVVGFVGIHAAQLSSAWVPLLMLTIASAAFTIVRIKTDSVSAAVLMHVGYNGTLFIALFLATSGFRNLEKLAR